MKCPIQLADTLSMRQYLDLLQHIMDNGVDKNDRTGVGTRSVFGYQTRFNLSEGFPLLTTKKVPFRLIVEELLWFITGDTNIKYLVDHNVHIWDEWAFSVYLQKMKLEDKLERYSPVWKEKLAWFVEQIKSDDAFAKQWGELGPVYGKQWRRWENKDGEEIDQLAEVVRMIREEPNSRRILISGWNVGELQGLIKNKSTAPPSCHTLFQFVVVEGKLHCQLYQRSADSFLGVPFNIASYALLTMMLAHVTNLEPGEFIHTFGDLHVYKNHFDQVREQLSREPRKLPTVRIVRKVTNIDDFHFEDFALDGYDPYPAIKAPIAV